MRFLEINLSDFFSSLGIASIVIPLLQLAIGGIPTTLKRWFTDKNDFSKRVNQLIEKKNEEICILLYRIFDRGLNTDISLRGQMPEHPDLIYLYHKELYNLQLNIKKFEKLYFIYKLLNRVLLFISILGIVLFLLVFIKSISQYVLLLCIFLIIIEIVVIYLMYIKVEALEELEYIESNKKAI